MNFSTLSQMWYESKSIEYCYSYQIQLKSLIKHMNSFIGDIPITEVKPLDITNMVKSLAIFNPNTKRPMAKQTLRTMITTTYRIFDMAFENDWIVKNPAKNRSVPKNAPKKQVQAISREEQILILNTPHRCRTAALLMVLMGIRTSEMLALQWRNIDFEKKRAYICEHAVKTAPNRYEVMPGTKTGKSRYVTIPDNLCAYLKNEFKNTNSKFIFPKTDGKLNTPSSWRSVWKSFLGALSFNFTEQKQSKYCPKGYPKVIEINPHQLRHTYATLLYISGVDVLTAKELLGHSDVSITLGIYTHLEQEYKTLNINNFNNYLADELCKDFCKTEKS